MLLFSFCLRIQSHWEFLYLPVFVGITLLEHRASFSNIKHFEENEKRHLECAFCWSCLSFLSTAWEMKIKNASEHKCSPYVLAAAAIFSRMRAWGWRELPSNKTAVYKSGRGTSGRVCGDSGTWGRETRDLRTSCMGHGDPGTSNTGTQGTWDVNKYCKSRR